MFIFSSSHRSSNWWRFFSIQLIAVPHLLKLHAKCETSFVNRKFLNLESRFNLLAKSNRVALSPISFIKLLHIVNIRGNRLIARSVRECGRAARPIVLWIEKECPIWSKLLIPRKIPKFRYTHTQKTFQCWNPSSLAISTKQWDQQASRSSRVISDNRKLRFNFVYTQFDSGASSSSPRFPAVISVQLLFK